jgi:hypothetical protein
MMRDFLTQSSRRRHRGLEGIYKLDIRPTDRRQETSDGSKQKSRKPNYSMFHQMYNQKK